MTAVAFNPKTLAAAWNAFQSSLPVRLTAIHNQPAQAANDGFPGLRKGFANPCSQRTTAGIAQSPDRGSNASIVDKVVLDRRILLRLRELRFSACVARWQIATLLVLAVPVLEGIFGGVTQLPVGGPDSLAQLDVELDGSDSVFVGIHELPSR